MSAGCAFLLSDDPSAITGVNLAVDHGWTGTPVMLVPVEELDKAGLAALKALVGIDVLLAAMNRELTRLWKYR